MSAENSWFSNASAALLMLAITACQTPAPDPPIPPDSVAEHIPTYRAFDRRPDEFIWSQRPADFDQIVDFERQLGWTVTTSSALKADFLRSQEKQLFDEYVGLITWTAPSRESPSEQEHLFELRPPEPLLVRDPINSASLWLQTDSPVAAVFLMRDAQGQIHPIKLGSAAGPAWQLLHRTLPDHPFQWPEHYPLELIALQLSARLPHPSERIFLDAAALYTASQAPLGVSKRPRRTLPLRDGQQLGWNIGEGTLSFPDRAQTILPDAAADAPDLILFESPADGRQTLRSARQPANTFHIALQHEHPVIEVRRHEQPTGFAFRLASDGPAPAPPWIAQASETEWRVEYTDGTTYRFTLQGESLILDVVRRGGQTTAVTLELQPALIPPTTLPFTLLTSTAFATPPVFMQRHPNGPLFAHMMIDFYRSNASSLSWHPDRQQLAAHYHPPLGRRAHDVFERFVISLSDQLDAVLPRIPHRAAERVDAWRDLIWSPSPSSVSGANLLITTDADIWSEGEGSHSFRIQANPQRGGHAWLSSVIRERQVEGHQVALHLNLSVLSPLNDHWSPDRVLLNTNGQWQSVSGGYLPKPHVAWQWLWQNGAKIRDTLAPDAVYLEGIGATPPWTFTDFDIRSPGAATFSQAFYAAGEGMLEASAQLDAHTLVAAAGGLYYAGLVDGFLALESCWQQKPWLPAFKLTRAQHLSVFFGAGPTPSPLEEAEIDRYLANQIAYGNAGRLLQGGDEDGLPGRSYWMMKAIQPLYLWKTPVRMRYWDGTLLTTAEDAYATGNWQRSQLYVQYPDEAEIWVNGSEDEIWPVRVGEEIWQLPPNGWVARAPHRFIFSGMVDGHRIDYAETPDFTYFHPRGRPTTFRGLESDQPLLLH